MIPWTPPSTTCRTTRRSASTSTSAPSSVNGVGIAGITPCGAASISCYLLGSSMTDVAVQDHPAVDEQLDAGDVARGVGGEEDDRVGDLLRRGDAAERNAVLVVAANLGGVGDRVQRRVGRSRRECVDGDPVRPELDRERLRQPEDP